MVFFAARLVAADDAADLAQEVVLRVLTRLRRGEQLHDVRIYGLGVARNVLHEYRRDPFALRRTPEDPDEMVATTADDALAGDDDRADALRGCLDQLSPGEQRLLHAYYGEGKNAPNRAALAAELGVTMNALWIRASRLRDRMRQCAQRLGT